MDIKQIFLSNVKDLLQEKGMSFRAFSFDVGISRRTMNRWSFDRSPRPKSVSKIADYFNCSIDFLLDRVDSSDFIPNKQKANFYERYSILKERNNFCDSKIAKMCNIKSSTISNWKHGATPSLEVVNSLCDIFYCSFDFLIGRTDS